MIHFSYNWYLVQKDINNNSFTKLSLLEYNEMTKKARQVIEAQHSNEKMVDDFNAFYERILTKEVHL